MTFEWFVAMRYLRSPHKPAVLRLITVLSVVGVAAGVATLVIALAVNTGFREALRDRLLGVTAHINLTRKGSEGIADYAALTEKLRKVEGVRAVSPAIYQTVLISGGGHARGIVLKGIDPAHERESSETLTRLTAGKADFAPDGDGIEAILLGKLLAQELRANVDDYITLTSPQGRLTPFGMIPRTRRLRVAGVFDSGFYDTDANWAFVTLSTAQALSGVGDQVNVLEFRLFDLDQAGAIAPRIRAAAGGDFSTSTWMEQNKALFSALRLEKLITAIFIGLITFVAGLNILVVLSMTVTDKARDIAVLKSMGARTLQVRKIFFWQGLCVGGVGTLIGLTIGYSSAWIADKYKMIPLDPEVYAIPYVPLHVSAFDGLWIAAIALGISAAATLLPARSASGILPVEILRYD